MLKPKGRLSIAVGQASIYLLIYFIIAIFCLVIHKGLFEPVNNEQGTKCSTRFFHTFFHNYLFSIQYPYYFKKKITLKIEVISYIDLFIALNQAFETNYETFLNFLAATVEQKRLRNAYFKLNNVFLRREESKGIWRLRRDFR